MTSHWVKFVAPVKEDPFMREWADEEVMAGRAKRLSPGEINYLHRWGFTTGLGGENLRAFFGHVRALEGEIAALRRILPRHGANDKNGRLIKAEDNTYRCERCRKAEGRGASPDAGWCICDKCGADTWCYGTKL